MTTLRRPKSRHRLVAYGAAGLIACLVAPGAWAYLPPTALAPGCQVNGQVDEILWFEGVYYVAGQFDRARPHGAAPGDPSEVIRRAVVACDAETGDVLAWDALLDHTNVNTPPAARALATSPDGSILYVGGRFNRVDGVAHNHAVALDRATGTRIATFVPNPNGRVHEILLAPGGGSMWIGGNFTTVGGTGRTSLAAVNSSTGALLASFAPVLQGRIDEETETELFKTVYSLALSVNGDTLYVGGQFAKMQGADRSGAAALDPDDATLFPFAPELTDVNPADKDVQIHEIVLFEDHVYLCGDWWATEGTGTQIEQRNLDRFDPVTGEADLAWNQSGGTDGGVQACDLDIETRTLYVGGHFDYVGGTDPEDRYRDIFALDIDTGTLRDWRLVTSGIPGIWAVEVAGRKLALGGLVTMPQSADEALYKNLLVFDLGAGFYPVTPCRALDTRKPTGPTAGQPLAHGSEFSLDVRVECPDVDPHAVALSLNLTATQSTTSGGLIVWPSSPAGTLPSISFTTGQTRANNLRAKVGNDGRIILSPNLTGPGSMHVIVDVSGYFR